MANFSGLIKNCYRLPWTLNNNPNGWIEPTTCCQLKCPGCYRGRDKDGVACMYLDLDELKNQINRFINERNVETISIAGGEPLLYPKLKELILYIKSRKLKTRIFTNGVLLDAELLEKLKEWGASEIVIHVDKFQTRNGVKFSNEAEVNKIREEYCNIFRKTSGINLGFIQPFSKDSLSNIPEVLGFMRKNADIVSVIVFTLYSDINWNNSVRANIDTDIKVSDVVNEIENHFNYIPCSYLGSTEDPDDPTWLFSISASYKDSSIGFFDGKFDGEIESRYYARKGKYLITKVGNKISIFKLIKFINYKCIRDILKNYIISLIKKPSRIKEETYLQKFLILRGPKFSQNGVRDLCAGCPDVMFYDNKLVPSCILDEIKLGRDFEFKDWQL
ncbi:MAG: radical SAM protein [Candidatus Pacebacteria bacterium]|nr:radical SAM protein [Candidatus Paceibacterota bacterium]